MTASTGVAISGDRAASGSQSENGDVQEWTVELDAVVEGLIEDLINSDC